MSKFGEAKLRPTTSLTASFGTRSSAVADGKGGMNFKLVKNSDGTNGTRSRSQPRPSDKGKEPIREASPFGRDTNGATSYSSNRYDNSRPITVERTASGRSKLRGSLVAASDALTFKFRRRKPSIRPPPRQIILPGVLEISAQRQRQDEEVEERNRLREMAAQAIGLGPFMVSQGSGSHAESTTEDEDEDRFPSSENNTIPRFGYPRSSGSTPNVTTRSPHDFDLSESISSQPSAGRLRSGSMLARSPTMTTADPIPPFPSTVLALTLFRQTSGMYPKYYPPSSLRIFALSKSWKNRFLVLSTPAKLVTRGQIPAVSYLHLFKSSSPDEKEMERLEINEDSVVFVSEEEVGGRRQVIKVGGTDVGAMKKEYTYDEGGYTMWLFQITDQAEAQQWITNIKSAILGQRTVRAGLIPTLGNHEPRGDMDVMLSIRTQALASAPISKPRSTHSTSPNNASHDRHSTPSISSQSPSQRTDPKSSGPVSALKGLFTTRSRSGSRAASVDFEKQQERENQDDLSANMRSLLSVLRPSTPDTPSVSAPARKSVPVDPFDRRIDRRILTERQPVQWATADQPPVNKDRTNRALSLGAFSLQPPPRKHSIRPISELGSPDSTGVGKKTNRIALQVDDFSSGSRSPPTGRAETESFYTTNQLSAFQFGIPEQDSRTPSVRSVSTVNSRDHRSSSSTNRSSAPKRWSRQGILPNQLTPPTEPPPAIPGNILTPGPHLYAAERTSSPTPSGSSEKSIVSTLPPFSKRNSSSSAKTVNSYDASRLHSIGTGASSTNGSVSTRSSHRVSMPPPLPPPTVALPPAPVQESQDTSTPPEALPPPSKSSFRNSVAQRAFRLPTTAPKPPPSTSLPPRPDESEMKKHHRSLSGNHSIHGHSTTLEPIPGSPVKSTSPFPPPVGPLPPTPPEDSLPSLQLPPVKQPSSIKRRLRMLSSPLPSAVQLQDIPTTSPRSSMDVASPIFMTPPASPIGEKITLLQNDPSFLQMHMSTLPSRSLNLSQVPPLPEEDAGITTSLSPPPRRGSRQLLETELEGPRRIAVPNEALLTVGEEPKHLSLSRPGSIMSINVSACCQESDGDNSPFGVTPTDDLPEEPLEEKLTVEPRHLSLSRPGSVISLGIMTLQ